MRPWAFAGIGLAGMAAVMWSSSVSPERDEAWPPSSRRPLDLGPPLTLGVAAEQAVYQRDVELQLAAYQQRLQRLQREAADATPQAREALLLEAAIDELTAGLAQAHTALERLRRAGESTWLTRRVAMEEALQSLQEAFAGRTGEALLVSVRPVG